MRAYLAIQRTLIGTYADLHTNTFDGRISFSLDEVPQSVREKICLLSLLPRAFIGTPHQSIEGVGNHWTYAGGAVLYEVILTEDEATQLEGML